MVRTNLISFVCRVLQSCKSLIIMSEKCYLMWLDNAEPFMFKGLDSCPVVLNGVKEAAIYVRSTTPRIPSPVLSSIRATHWESPSSKQMGHRCLSTGGSVSTGFTSAALRARAQRAISHCWARSVGGVLIVVQAWVWSSVSSEKDTQKSQKLASVWICASRPVAT